MQRLVLIVAVLVAASLLAVGFVWYQLGPGSAGASSGFSAGGNVQVDEQIDVDTSGNPEIVVISSGNLQRMMRAATSTTGTTTCLPQGSADTSAPAAEVVEESQEGETPDDAPANDRDSEGGSADTADQGSPFGSLRDADLRCLFADLYADEFETELSGQLARTSRFNIGDRDRVYDFIRNSQSRRSGAGNDDDTEQRSAAQDRLDQFWGQVTVEVGEIGEHLELDYFLVLSLTDPQVTFEIEEGVFGREPQVLIRSNPVFLYSLYNAQTGVLIASDHARLDEDIAVAIEADDLRLAPELHLRRAISELQFDRFEVVSRNVTRAVIDEIFPARVSGFAPGVVFTRGRADGVAVGDEYDVYRTGVVQDPSNPNVQIAGPRQTLGRIRVLQADEIVSVGEVISMSGGQIRVGDLIDMPGGPGTTGSSSFETTGQTAQDRFEDARTERRELSQNLAADDAARVAVGAFRIRHIGLSEGQVSAISQDFQSALGRSLAAGDIRVISLQDLNQIDEQFRLSQQNNRRRSAGGARIDVAGYVIEGAITLAVEEETRQASLAGRSRSLPSNYFLNAAAEVRITRTDGTLLPESPRIETREQLASTDTSAMVTTFSRMADRLAARAATQIRNSLTSGDLVIVRVAENRITIAAGENLLPVGAQVRAYHLGETLYHPDGRDLGRDRSLAGTLRVIDADENLSYAEPVGPVSELTVGDIVELSDENR